MLHKPKNFYDKSYENMQKELDKHDNKGNFYKSRKSGPYIKMPDMETACPYPK